MSKITMDSIIKGVETVPLVTIIHGKESVGKTYMACQSDSPIMLDMEHGAEIHPIQKIPLYGKDVVFDDCIEALRLIYAQHKKMGVKTVIVDSFDWVQKLIHKEVCSKKKCGDYRRAQMGSRISIGCIPGPGLCQWPGLT